MRQINEDLNNNIEKGIFIRDNIQKIAKDRVSIYLNVGEILHEVSRAN